MKKKEEVVARFAPSPTGPLHVGGVRSALFNYFFTRQNKGKLILRIEDTDKERSRPEYEKDIVEGFKWLNLKFDEIFRQSDRTTLYKKYLEKLIAGGKAYVSKEKPTLENPRTEVVRFKNQNKRVTFDDLIKGKIEFDTTELGDFVIAKSLDEPIFHLTNVVDDYEMKVTHIIRGEDHISNTPRQILINEAIGGNKFTYAHIPLILAPDRAKLSKRKHGESVSLQFYRKRGYLPEAMINFLALLGWNPGDDREVMDLDTVVKEFRLDRVQKGGAIFDIEKLNWMNKEYLTKMPKGDVAKEILQRIDANDRFSSLAKQQKINLAPALAERLHYFGEIDDALSGGEYDYLLAVPAYKPESLLWKDSHDLTEVKNNIIAVSQLLKSLEDYPAKEQTKKAVWKFAEEKGIGAVLWPTRFALSGQQKSLDPFTLISILGKSESLSRLKSASDLIK